MFIADCCQRFQFIISQRSTIASANPGLSANNRKRAADWFRAAIPGDSPHVGYSRKLAFLNI